MTELQAKFPIGSPVSIKGNPRTFKESPAIVVDYDRGNVVVTFPSHYDKEVRFIFCPEDVVPIDKKVRLHRANEYLELAIHEIREIGSSPKLYAVTDELRKAFSNLVLVPEFVEDFHRAIINCIENTEIHSESKHHIYLAMRRNKVDIEVYQFEAAFKELFDSHRVFYSNSKQMWLANV